MLLEIKSNMLFSYFKIYFLIAAFTQIVAATPTRTSVFQIPLLRKYSVKSKVKQIN